MGIFNFLEEKKAQMDVRKINKRLKEFNTKIYHEDGNKITVNSFEGLELKCNEHNEQEILTLNGNVLFRKENTIDGETVIDINPQQIKNIKEKLEHTIASYSPNQAHDIDVNNTIEVLHNQFKHINTGNFEQPKEEGITLKNKIGNVEYYYNQTIDPETEEVVMNTKMWLGYEMILYRKQTIDENNEEKQYDTFLDSQKIMKAKENVDNTLNNSFENKPLKKNPRKNRIS